MALESEKARMTTVVGYHSSCYCHVNIPNHNLSLSWQFGCQRCNCLMLELFAFDLQFALCLLLHYMQLLIAVLPIGKTSMGGHLPDLDHLAFALACKQTSCSTVTLIGLYSYSS